MSQRQGSSLESRPVETLLARRALLRRLLGAGLLSAGLLTATTIATPEIASAQATKAPDLLKPVQIEFPTADGVILKGTYFPSKLEKEAVPIVLLHAFGRSRADWQAFAEELQGQGHAVVTVDLRCHGESTTATALKRPLTIKDCDKRAIERMYQDDLEAVKRWLMAQNNAGQLNIEKLTVVGAEMGAVVALNWAAIDWSYPPLAGGGKQGQDVKALVLISPELNFKGVRADLAVQALAKGTKVAVQIAVGEQKRDAEAGATSVFRLLKPHRSTDIKDPEKARAEQDLFLTPLRTSLQGTDILGKNLGLEGSIARFVEYRLVNKPFPWRDRTQLLK